MPHAPVPPSATPPQLGKLGIEVEEARDYCVIQPPKAGGIKPSVAIDTYDDHRMAMCFALVSCGGVPCLSHATILVYKDTTPLTSPERRPC